MNVALQDIHRPALAKLLELFAAPAGEDEQLQRVAESFVPTLADWSAIDLVDDHGFRRAASVELDDLEWIDAQRALRTMNPPAHDPRRLRELLERGDPEISQWRSLRDVGAEEAAERTQAFVSSTLPASVITAPLVASDRRLGLLTLVARRGRPAYTQDDCDLVAMLAALAAATIEQARLRRALDTETAARQRAIQSLHESEERYRLVALASREAIWDVDARTGLVHWNPMFAELFLYAPEDVRRDIAWRRELIHPDDRGRAVQEYEGAVAAREAFCIRDYRFRRGDGTYAEVHDSAYIAYDGEGNVIRIVGSMSDVTRQRQLNQQFATAQRMEAIGRLAGGIAHDFNNLLTAIRGFATFALEAQLPRSPAREDIEQILVATDRAAALTRQLLAFSRRQVLKPESLNINQLLSGLGQLFARVVPASIDIRYYLADDVWPVFVDAGQFEQVIVNLIVNARDAMPNGGLITIETGNATLTDEYVQAHHGSTAGDFVVVTITDSGIGMDAQTQARIFEPFFTTKGREHGTGLGLSTSYGIVKQSGGHIWVYSEPHHGSSFKVFLPRSHKAPVAVLDVDRVPARLAGTETVLLVEDDERVRRVASLALGRHGYHVLEAATPEEALDLFARHMHHIELVVSDVVLPQTSGPELHRKLAMRKKGLRVVYISGYSETTIVQREHLEPGADVLEKPFAPEALVRRVREVLDRG
jgi:PAS domain S-box-containing protein